MKLRYLGTAAAEGVPAIGCTCRVCRESRRKGGRCIRSRSQAIVNDELLIDFGPDTYWHVNAWQIDLSEIDHCLITHSHADHLTPGEIDHYAPAYSHGRTTPMHFYAGQSGYDRIRAVTERPEMGGRVATHLLHAGEAFCIDDKYDVLPVSADHAPQTSPLLYSMAQGGKRLLYAHDSGWLPDDAWADLSARGRHDLISLDCTGCLALDGDWTVHHMSLGTILRLIDRMKQEGIADDDTVFVLNHFSHNGGQDYDEMVMAAAKHGLLVSYDGMEVIF